MARTLQQLLGLALPIIQAPMAGVQGSALAVAVCKAGALGSLPGAMLGLQALHQELSILQAQTDRPYNVNFFCHQQPSAADQAIWQETLAPYFAELGVDRQSLPTGPSPSTPRPPQCSRPSSLRC